MTACRLWLEQKIHNLLAREAVAIIQCQHSLDKDADDTLGNFSKLSCTAICWALVQSFDLVRGDSHTNSSGQVCSLFKQQC